MTKIGESLIDVQTTRLFDVRQQRLSEIFSDSNIPPLKETVSKESLSPFVEVEDSSELTLFRNMAGAQPSCS